VLVGIQLERLAADLARQVSESLHALTMRVFASRYIARTDRAPLDRKAGAISRSQRAVSFSEGADAI
jgi:hypothetical protein